MKSLNKIQRFYCDTSVFGGYFDKEFKEASRKLFKKFQKSEKILVLSDLTMKELELAPEKVRKLLEKIPENSIEKIILNNEVIFLAEKYIKERALSKKYFIDAQHIALATVYKVDVVVSWNFKHIVNLRRINLFNATNLKYGYSTIEIRSPLEVLYE